MLILANAFFVAGEFAIVAVERAKVERRASEGDRRARRVLVSLRSLSFELSGAQLGITVTSLVLGAIAEPTIARLLEPLLRAAPWIPRGVILPLSFALALTIAVATQMVFGELVPKNLAIARPYRSAVWFGIPMQMVNRVLRPLILFLNNSANATVRLLGIEPREELAGVRSMEELELMIRSSGEEGRIDDDELDLLTRAITFTEKVAADAMVPRVNLISLNRHDPVTHMRRLAASTGHSRFPVVGDDLDEVLGIVHIKDTLSIPEARLSITQVADIASPALVVPESASLESLLNLLQTEGRGMAVVVDEYGGTAGVVTVEDLLEELLGEIEDEYDPPLEVSEMVEGAEISGLLHRHETEDLIGFEWPEGRYETLGGFLVSRLGRFPREGEVVDLGEFAFEIAQMDGHRVDQVRLVRRPEEESD